MDNIKIYMTPRDVGKMLNLSMPKVYELLHRKDSPGFRIGRKWVIPYEAFVKWLNSQAEKRGDTL